MAGKLKVRGGCHCGAVRFEAVIRKVMESQVCNCSICRKCGFQHLIVPAGRFKLIAGEDRMNEYRFGSGEARHLFCKECGVKSYYVPRSNPDGFSLNVRCLDLPLGAEVEFREFDGRNWSKNAAALKNLSEE